MSSSEHFGKPLVVDTPLPLLGDCSKGWGLNSAIIRRYETSLHIHVDYASVVGSQGAEQIG